MQVTAVYPGTFDPITNGHLDIIGRGVHLFDRVVVALLQNADKEPLLPLDERMAIVRSVVARFPNVEVDSFDGLLVDYARARGARAIVRGLRALSDFEYEFQMALMNRRLEPGVETVFMMPSEAWSYVSSRLVKEVARLGGDVSGLVPPEVAARLKTRYAGAGKPR
ncbi:MAG TPA: pantetheine-phosphate adenylyltransferase [Candidatus Polarisedimenticolia bacterium]|nr:pantetheine-phosphate adenylyltransferase [Candidatus Polarisedimenticolia bacterium]